MQNEGLLKIRIFIMAHKSFVPPAMEEYVPLQVGSALHEDLGYVRDDTGDNISDLNPYYAELTGQYWLWKNCPEVDIIGCCHYRRYILNEKGDFIRTEDIEELLQEYDIIAPGVEDPASYRELYIQAHGQSSLEALRAAMRRLYPQEADILDKLYEEHMFCYGNMYIMTKPLFDEYMEWLFPLLLEAGEEIDPSAYDDYHKKVFGILGENLIRVFAAAHGKKLYVAKGAMTDAKVETKELKLTLEMLIREGNREKARKLYEDYIKVRPDVLLEQSDVGGALKKIGDMLREP